MHVETGRVDLNVRGEINGLLSITSGAAVTDELSLDGDCWEHKLIDATVHRKEAEGVTCRTLKATINGGKHLLRNVDDLRDLSPRYKPRLPTNHAEGAGAYGSCSTGISGGVKSDMIGLIVIVVRNVGDEGGPSASVLSFIGGRSGGIILWDESSTSCARTSILIASMMNAMGDGKMGHDLWQIFEGHGAIHEARALRYREGGDKIGPEQVRINLKRGTQTVPITHSVGIESVGGGWKSGKNVTPKSEIIELNRSKVIGSKRVSIGGDWNVLWRNGQRGRDFRSLVE